VVRHRRIQFRGMFYGLSLLLCAACACVPAAAQLETRATTTIPGEVLNIVSGDFNSDGKLDIAVAGSRVWVLLGDGDGTFQKPETYSYKGLGFAISSADFNGDGKLDLVINGPGSAVSVLLGNGDGTFQAPLVSSATEAPTFVAVGDFNHDGKMDVVIIDPPYISVLLGNGDGTFQAPKDNSSFPDYPVWLVVGDFNNDHRLDVAVVGYFGSNIDMGVLLGNGDGTLQPSLTSPLNDTPYSIAAGDFNHDGNLDIAISDYFIPGDVVVELGNGDGSFQSAVDYPTGAGGEVVAYDLNGDGKLDLVLGGGVLFGNGDGTFQPMQLFPGAGSPFVVGDFNGDRKPDVAGLIGKPSGVVTLLNTGVVNFSPSSPVSFAAQLINTTSSPQTVELTNTGATTLSISSIKISGQFQTSNSCGNSLAPGASCAISITFSPKSAGQFSGLITIVDSASSEPQVIEVSGSGTVVGVSPTSLSFCSQKVGTKSAPQVVTAVNHSGTQMLFEGIDIGGTDRNDFSETDNCTGRFIPPGGGCQVSVTFAPTKTGLRSGTLFLAAEGRVSPQPVVLTGDGS
jgi:archaellum component FlaF (FlaF/FlaG flagellin family)